MLGETATGTPWPVNYLRYALTLRWDDDVVFKNQAREPKKEARRFINDTVRNDFHRKFLQRYIK